MRITHELGQWVSLTDDNGIERLRYDYGSAPKPFIHPLRLPDGTIITEHEPTDHTWHRGLWFAFKFVNGINYWEERDEVCGRQATRKTPQCVPKLDGTVTLWSTVDWCDQDKNRVVEFREWQWQLTDSGGMQLSWHSRLEAQEALDRTPFTTWGGYGGLFVRLLDDLKDARLVFSDGTIATKCTGERYEWGGIEGTTPNGQDCAVVFLPDPANPRWPEPFYGHAKPNYHFFGPAPLFHEPLALAAGEILDYRVRVLVLPRRIGALSLPG